MRKQEIWKKKLSCWKKEVLTVKNIWALKLSSRSSEKITRFIKGKLSMGKCGLANPERYKGKLGGMREEGRPGRLMKYLLWESELNFAGPPGIRLTDARILEITKIYRRAVALPRAATHVSRAPEVTICSRRIKLG